MESNAVLREGYHLLACRFDCLRSQEKQALKTVRFQRHLPLTIQFYTSCRISGVPPLQSDFSGLSSALKDDTNEPKKRNAAPSAGGYPDANFHLDQGEIASQSFENEHPPVRGGGIDIGQGKDKGRGKGNNFFKKEIMDSKAVQEIAKIANGTGYRKWLTKTKNLFEQAQPGARKMIVFLERIKDEETIAKMRSMGDGTPHAEAVEAIYNEKIEKK